MFQRLVPWPASTVPVWLQAPAAAMASFGAFAQTSPGESIIASVTSGMTDGQKIAAAVVTGWCVKLLWRSK